MKRTAIRIATALITFSLGTTASSLLHRYRIPETSPPLPAAKAPPATPPVIAPPVPERDTNISFGGGLKLVSHELTLKNELLRYKVTLTYPQIEGANTLRIRRLNKYIERLAKDNYQWLLNPSPKDLHYFKHGPHPQAFNSTSLDYEVVLATDSFLSIYFECYTYGIGAAHSVQTSYVVNYDLGSDRLVKLSEIFKPGSDYLELISKICTEQLSHREYGNFLFGDELTASPKNFESWNVTANGIRFNFDACRVLACAAGAQTVEIPFSALRPVR